MLPRQVRQAPQARVLLQRSLRLLRCSCAARSRAEHSLMLLQAAGFGLAEKTEPAYRQHIDNAPLRLFTSQPRTFFLCQRQGGGLWACGEDGALTRQSDMRYWTFFPATGLLQALLCPDTCFDAIQVADFGLAEKTELGGTMTTICGTPQYVAPEVIQV